MTHSTSDKELETFVETRGVEGAYEAGVDGFLLNRLDSNSTDPEAVAAASAVAAITSQRIGSEISLGKLKWILMEFKTGKVIIAQQKNGFWVVVGSEHMVFGDILMKVESLEKSQESDTLCKDDGQ